MSSYDYTKYDPTKEEFPTLPPGWHTLIIDTAIEKVSKKGHPMMEIDCSAMNEEGSPIVDENISVRHWVTLIPVDQQGAGIAVHFIKSIGLPPEGELNPFQWEGRRFKAKIASETYEGKTRSKIKEVSPHPQGPIAGTAPVVKQKEEEDVPF